MAEPSVTPTNHPDMMKMPLASIAVASLIGAIGLIGMLNSPIITSAILILLLVVILRTGGAS
ncbi:hypothetical protein SAMN02744133_102481 [Thalassospira xiamenensis M-5 = DSM 17429]|uniref:hypothetical protein n=1 Tax=Thalassospira xiamenensis TaxID=220697 RepID=UPI0009556816|nr:hypothetical protein [Thalassospira xiamenensis]SIS81424.1 hypothetical protein SAMN02744133_102481 [Thalassospira xiamenensis M-5 = DSM 17429]